MDKYLHALKLIQNAYYNSVKPEIIITIHY